MDLSPFGLPTESTSGPTGRKLLLGLIGAGIQGSLSPAMHEEEARQQGLRLHYQLIDLDHSAQGAKVLPVLIEAASVMGFAGLNVTSPCKQQVIPLLDALTDEAQQMGAVNTIEFRDGRLIGHNTDGAGWAWAFRRAMPEADLSEVVLIGAGGAGSAIAHALLALGARRLSIVDSDHQRAQALVRELDSAVGSGRAIMAADIDSAMAAASGLVHATPTGMSKQPGLPLPPALLRPGLWVSEVVYFPLDTALLVAARRAGCVTLDGGGMAVGQAVRAFEIFTGLPADTARMDAHFRRLVSSAGGS